MSGALNSDNTHVLVVAQSRISLVIVSEIVHRCGLRAVGESVAGAAAQLKSNRPRLVILDGGADNRDCDSLFEAIEALQRTSDSRGPRVIMLSNRSGSADGASPPAFVDHVVAKPISPERLQPVIELLVRRKA